MKKSILSWITFLFLVNANSAGQRVWLKTDFQDWIKNYNTSSSPYVSGYYIDLLTGIAIENECIVEPDNAPVDNAEMGTCTNGYIQIRGSNNAEIKLPVFKRVASIELNMVAKANRTIKLFNGSTELSTFSVGTTGSTFIYEIPVSEQANEFNFILKEASGPVCICDIAVYKETPTEIYSVTFNAGTGSTAIANLTEASAGAGITLPNATSCQAEWEFAGWSEEVLTETKNKPVLYPAESNYYPLKSHTLHAVYTTTDKNTRGNYELVTNDLHNWSGDYLIAYSPGIFLDGSLDEKSLKDSHNIISPENTPSTTTISSTWGDNYKFMFEEVEDGYLLKNSGNYYLYHTNNTSNGVSATTNKSTAAKYPLTVSFINRSNIEIRPGGSAAGAVLHYNKSTNQSRFMYYKDGGNENIHLYKLSNKTYNSHPTCSTTILSPHSSPEKIMYVQDEKIHFATSSEEKIEIYNALGRCIYRGVTVNGQNSIAVEKGFLLVKIADKTDKLIVK